EADKSGKTRHPVWQQQRLGGSPKPEGGIHRVANPSVNSVGDQLMAFPHIEANRPVSPQGSVRQSKHHQRRRDDENAEPGFPGVSLSEPSSPIIERAPSEARVWYLAETGPHTSMK